MDCRMSSIDWPREGATVSEKPILWSGFRTLSVVPSATVLAVQSSGKLTVMAGPPAAGWRMSRAWLGDARAERARTAGMKVLQIVIAAPLLRRKGAESLAQRRR